MANQVNGLYVYCHDAAADIFYARGFNPMTGHKEDAATGVAAAALSLELKRSLSIKQGDKLGLPCNINIRFAGVNSIWVGGRTLLFDKKIQLLK